MMRLPKFEYIAPATIDEACALLHEYGPKGMIVAGGTDLLAAAKLGNIQPVHLVSLKRIKELRGITYQEREGLKIGAMTPLYRVREDPNVRTYYQALAMAASAVGSPQIQRMGTLGGNICLNTRCYFYNQSSSWRRHRPICFKMGGNICHVVPKGKKCHAVFSADTPPVLIAFDAKVKLVGDRGERVVPIKDLYTGDGKRPITLSRDEILTEIQLPPISKRLSIYFKHRIRKAIDFPVVGVAACIVLDERKQACINAKIVLNAVAPAPVIVTEAEPLIKESFLNRRIIAEVAKMAIRAASPVANIDSTPAHRRVTAGLLTQRALEIMLKDSTGNEE